MTKAADIMAAATPGPWWYDLPNKSRLVGPQSYNDDGSVATVTVVWDHYTDGHGSPRGADARAIVTAVNLFPLYEAVREAALALVNDDMGIRRGLVPATKYLALRAALDALQAAEDAL